ncbi:MAG: hypothetical protein JRI45_04950 [Deltaproteobacteria bacterium]|nr:hypothetical protein [Deltaproteobacteria bacterium]MBW2067895.1 hypothetical protein [Deltaproteobacteria bacterium]
MKEESAVQFFRLISCSNPQARRGANTRLDELLLQASPAEVARLIKSLLLNPNVYSFPEPLTEWLLDSWKTCERWPYDKEMLHRFVKKACRGRVKNFYAFLSRGFPIRKGELKWISLALLRSRMATSKDFRRRFRSFVLRVLDSKSRPEWNTSLDLLPLWLDLRSERYMPCNANLCRWRVVTTSIIKSMQRLNDGAGIKRVLKIEYWNGFRHQTVTWLARLLDCFVTELRWIRDFCDQVSEQTGRVVLSWHNATLGAAGGWAFLDCFLDWPWDLFQENSLLVVRWRDLLKSEDLMERLTRIWHIYFQRMFAQKFQFLKRRYDFKNHLVSDFEENADLDDGYYFPLEAAHWQNITRNQLSSWCLWEKRNWAKGWTFLSALIEQGYELLRDGVVRSVVIPRIDKFFASTARTRDIEYLTEALRNLCTLHGNKIVIMLWDDTTRTNNPSLYLAIEKLRAHKLPVGGLGIFEKGVLRSRNPEVEDVINMLKDYCVFVLRPVEKSAPNFYHLLQARDFGFFEEYAPSWRDGVVFIYTGTQVFCFPAIQTSFESYVPWVVLNGKALLFGQFLRELVKKKVSKTDISKLYKSMKLRNFYLKWAHLE